MSDTLSLDNLKKMAATMANPPEPPSPFIITPEDAKRFGIEADDPQRTSGALLLLTIAVGVLPGVIDRVLGVAVEFGFTREISLGVLQDFLAALVCGGGVGDTRHVLYGIFLAPTGRLVRIHPSGGLRLLLRSSG